MTWQCVWILVSCTDPWLKRAKKWKKKEKHAKEKTTKVKKAERRRKEKTDDDNDNDEFDNIDKECDQALEAARRKAATASLC